MVGFVDLSTHKSHESSMKGFHAQYTEIPICTASRITSATIAESDCLKMLGLNFSLPKKKSKKGRRKDGGERLDAVKGHIRSYIHQAGKTNMLDPEIREKRSG